MMIFIAGVKTAIDIGLAVGFFANRQVGEGVLAVGYAVADFGMFIMAATYA